ncbi:MAG: TldD/PmbA family protein [Candidatus Bathyarchaeia archaeon]
MKLSLSWIDTAYKALDEASRAGVAYADARCQEYVYEHILVENGSLKEYSRTVRRGLGLRVLLDGSIGFASTNDLSASSIDETVRYAISAARSMKGSVELSAKNPIKARARSSFSENPLDPTPEDKIGILLSANRESMIDGVKSTSTRLGIQYDRRLTVSTDGCEVEVECFLVGLGHMSVAYEAGKLERVYDSRSRVSGWEFISNTDWCDYTRGISRLAVEAVRSPTPKAGVYRAVVDPELIGLVIHEAFGHAVEGDLVASGSSILAGRLGGVVASPYVTIIDDGLIEGGYYVPYDDEGVEKKPVIVVDNGVLKAFLTHLASASKLRLDPTGNGRAQDFHSQPIARQTNLYMKPGDYRFEELLEDVGEGIYLRGMGAGGGQVDPGTGSFTFSVGPSYMVRRGELAELVRGTVVSGLILETLKGVEAVGCDLSMETSVFGGCGKEGQIVRVGDGGPHVEIKQISVGGG